MKKMYNIRLSFERYHMVMRNIGDITYFMLQMKRNVVYLTSYYVSRYVVAYFIVVGFDFFENEYKFNVRDYRIE